MTHESQPAPTLEDYLSGDEAAATPLDDADEDVGSRITEARESAGMDREAFGAQVGVRPDTVAAWESGELVPRSNKLVAIAGVLGVSVSWLMIGHGETPPPRNGTTPLPSELADIRAELEDLVERIDRVVDALPDTGEAP